MDIDIEFDPRSEAGTRDPDRFSPTLRRFHQRLWSKPLPNGAHFDLSVSEPHAYLHHKSHLGEFWLSSDNIVATYSYWQRTTDLISQIPSVEVEEFDTVGSTVGGTIVFPSNRVDGSQTINARRGGHAAIQDRFDLTLECIRRYYMGKLDTPLGSTLAKYSTFFGLFGGFSGYVDFFLLQDLVDAREGVRFFLPHREFDCPPVPRDVAEYREFRDASLTFVRARNRRIETWASAQTS